MDNFTLPDYPVITLPEVPDISTAAGLRACLKGISVEPGQHYATPSGGFTRTGIWLTLVQGKPDRDLFVPKLL